MVLGGKTRRCRGAPLGLALLLSLATQLPHLPCTSAQQPPEAQPPRELSSPPLAPPPVPGTAPCTALLTFVVLGTPGPEFSQAALCNILKNDVQYALPVESLNGTDCSNGSNQAVSLLVHVAQDAVIVDVTHGLVNEIPPELIGSCGSYISAEFEGDCKLSEALAKNESHVIIYQGPPNGSLPETCEAQCEVAMTLTLPSDGPRDDTCDTFTQQVAQLANMDPTNFICISVEDVPDEAAANPAASFTVSATLMAADSNYLVLALKAEGNAGASALIASSSTPTEECSWAKLGFSSSAKQDAEFTLPVSSCGQPNVFLQVQKDGNSTNESADCPLPCAPFFELPKDSPFRVIADPTSLPDNYTYTPYDLLCVNGELTMPFVQESEKCSSHVEDCDLNSNTSSSGGDDNYSNPPGQGMMTPDPDEEGSSSAQSQASVRIFDIDDVQHVDVQWRFSTVSACCKHGKMVVKNCSVVWDLGETFYLSPANVVRPVSSVVAAVVSSDKNNPSYFAWNDGDTSDRLLNQTVGPRSITLQSVTDVSTDCTAGVKVELPDKPGWVRLSMGVPPAAQPVAPPFSNQPPYPSFHPPISTGLLPFPPHPPPMLSPSEESGGGGGVNVTDLAVGIVCGFLGLVLILGGLLIWFLWRKTTLQKAAYALQSQCVEKGKPEDEFDPEASHKLSPTTTATLSGDAAEVMKDASPNGHFAQQHQGATATITTTTAAAAAAILGSQAKGLPPRPPSRASVDSSRSASQCGYTPVVSQNVPPEGQEQYNENSPFELGSPPSWMRSPNGSTLYPLFSVLPSGAVGQGTSSWPASKAGLEIQSPNGVLHCPALSGIATTTTTWSGVCQVSQGSRLPNGTSITSSIRSDARSSLPHNGMIPEGAVAMPPSHVGLSSQLPSLQLGASAPVSGPSEGGSPTRGDPSALFSAYAQLAANILGLDAPNANAPGGGSFRADATLPGGGVRNQPWLHHSGSVREDVDLGMKYEELVFDTSAGGLLGAGAVGSVYKAQFRGQTVAVKVITQNVVDGNFIGSSTDSDSLQTEIQILSRLAHPNIVHLFGGCLRPPRVFIVEELMASTLSTLIHHEGPVDLQKILPLSLDIARGLAYLHKLNVIHRDLKPANILLDESGIAKISDFGLARCKYKTYLETKQTDAGTVAYMAPEAFNPDIGGISTKCDIFSFAVILWEMLCQEYPWYSQANMVIIYRVAVQNARLAIPEAHANFPPELVGLIQRCWDQDPKARPDIDEVVTTLESISALHGVDSTPRLTTTPLPLSKHASTRLSLAPVTPAWHTAGTPA